MYASVDHGTNVLTGDPAPGSTTVRAGLIYYQAGIAVITSSVLLRNEDHSNRTRDRDGATWADRNGSGLLHKDLGAALTASTHGHKGFNNHSHNYGRETFEMILTGSNPSASIDAFRARIHNIAFNNTTELNSTVYFCRANHNEFNYSANPTYLQGSKIRVKQQSTDQPVSYITTVGLYSADNELMGVAKLSEPLRKDPTNEMTLRVRLDY